MLQALLAERFDLKLHHEARSIPVYNLTSDKRGLKVKESTGPRPPQPVTYSGPLIRLNCIDKSMAELVALIAYYVDRPILEKTGLPGRYDFSLEFTRSNPEVAAPDSPDADASIYRAVQAQLGLKLLPSTETASVVVVDHAAPPTEN